MIVDHDQLQTGFKRCVIHIQTVALSLLLFGFSHTLYATTEAKDSIRVKQPEKEVFSIDIRYITLSKPAQFRNAKGKTEITYKVIEFRLVSSSTIPARGLDPVIAVGKYMVTEYHYLKPNVLIFIEYVPEKLQDGESIYFQWGKQPVKQQRWKLPVEYHLKSLKHSSVKQIKELYLNQK